MKRQKGDAGISMVLVMAVMTIGIWMFSDGHRRYGMMSSDTHKKAVAETQQTQMESIVGQDEEDH